jgi:hypothetical protein
MMLARQGLTDKTGVPDQGILHGRPHNNQTNMARSLTGFAGSAIGFLAYGKRSLAGNFPNPSRF